MLDFLIGFFTDYGYAAVFVILIACGFGLPVPEDITLVSGGVISGLGLTNPHIMLGVGLAGVLIGDSTMFLLGRVFGYRIQRIKTFRKILSPRRFSHIQRQFKKYGLGLLFVARFLPGLRSPIFLVAGMSRRISYLTFIAMDGVAALISVPIWVYMGFFFADNLDLLMEYVSDVQRVIYLILGLIILVVLAIYLKKRFHAKMDKHFAEGAGTETSAAATSTAASPEASSAAAAPSSAASETSAADPAALGSKAASQASAADLKEKEKAAVK